MKGSKWVANWMCLLRRESLMKFESQSIFSR